MKGPFACIRREIDAQELVTGLPGPEHVGAIERRACGERVRVIELEGHADRETNARVTLCAGGNSAGHVRIALARASQIHERDAVALPRRARRELERVRQIVLIDELDIVYIQLQV